MPAGAMPQLEIYRRKSICKEASASFFLFEASAPHAAARIRRDLRARRSAALNTSRSP
ncbi:hypothetical protein [Lysobacter gummosus]|uniref:hypothetical protein n=1 Tax=Lysobacter gummosus TaxID=262324 RepID=UPI00362ACED4